MSAEINRLVTAAKTDAEKIASFDFPAEDDTQVLSMIKAGKHDWHRLSTLLFSSANFHGRLAFVPLAGGKDVQTNLADAWKLYCCAARCREHWALEEAKKHPSHETLFSKSSLYWEPITVVEVALALWKLYAIGETHHVRTMAPLFELFDFRDVDRLPLSDEELESYDMAVCVSLLLARGDASTAAADRLIGRLPVFGGIAGIWEDDEAFRYFSNCAAQWHLDYSMKTTGTPTAFANVAADVVFPSWVFALDSFRQSTLGRPACLGDHELLNWGKRVIAYARGQRCETLPVLAAAEALERKTFGSVQFNPLPFWKEYLPSAE